MDNGSEYISHKLKGWEEKMGIPLVYIEPAILSKMLMLKASIVRSAMTGSLKTSSKHLKKFKTEPHNFADTITMNVLIWR